MLLRHSVVLFLGILITACQSREVQPSRTGKEYAPLAVGAFWEYSVTTTTISPVGGQTNVLTEERVEVTELLEENGLPTYVLRRWSRPQGTSDYTSAETWSVEAGEFRYIVQEGNIPYVRLQFPLTEGKTWNGNAYNTEGGTDDCGNGDFTCDMYMVSGLGQPFELPGVFSYDDTVTILEHDDDDPIVGKDVRQAVYADRIGLVYREETHLEYCTVGSCIGQQIVESGMIRRQTLLTYGTP